jgi:hypothetical protein
MNPEPTTYTIRVRGHLDDHWSTWFGGAELDRCDDGTTALLLSDADQARLHCVLGQLRDLGVELIELQTSNPSGVRNAIVSCWRSAPGL